MIRIYFLLLWSILGFSQTPIDLALKTYNSHSVPYIKVDKLATMQSTPVVLDTRTKKEYDTSHIKNAVHVGFDDFSLNRLPNTLSKNQMIIVYCSIGVRSENIGERLINEGYSKVYNLYGGIFEWKNNGYSVVDCNNEITEQVHAYSKKWSQYLTKGEKVYEH
jgi:rhodanese-related sulfurtransferase